MTCSVQIRQWKLLLWEQVILNEFYICKANSTVAFCNILTQSPLLFCTQSKPFICTPLTFAKKNMTFCYLTLTSYSSVEQISTLIMGHWKIPLGYILYPRRSAGLLGDIKFLINWVEVLGQPHAKFLQQFVNNYC